jgi:enamine deaminase RidA (YjgF/YER057c/UK114 family)
MSKNILRNPPTMKAPGARYTHGVQLPAGARTLYVAGQVGYDQAGNLPKDFVSQAENTFANLIRVLEDAGMAPKDVVNLNT